MESPEWWMVVIVLLAVGLAVCCIIWIALTIAEWFDDVKDQSLLDVLRSQYHFIKRKRVW